MKMKVRKLREVWLIIKLMIYLSKLTVDQIVYVQSNIKTGMQKSLSPKQPCD